jgi:hypothetical protein
MSDREIMDAKNGISPKTVDDYPDAKRHQIISFIKSGIRILGYIFIPFDLGAAVTLLVVSEGIGILEELV